MRNSFLNLVPLVELMLDLRFLLAQLKQILLGNIHRWLFSVLFGIFFLLFGLLVWSLLILVLFFDFLLFDLLFLFTLEQTLNIFLFLCYFFQSFFHQPFCYFVHFFKHYCHVIKIIKLLIIPLPEMLEWIRMKTDFLTVSWLIS